ncbi:amidase [Acetobacter nitrogenifigens DSM 23921 = NBRC 105050]|uniref:Amidase n=1 Tax=Acetobacter nitrogenifigens DSM 23921 = NBRC 105050 TaxID=1120919 RepID=A0A511X9M4_9PROT|nr:amidase [Acetobacter nitrogenifigens]GBQ93655.1 amidase [Acetobacter nitrogenifigens DSM 23921 = NBRC 105050]GEN59635.1 amidase [Acetobacter nitrogenifigens DSM 23921 = NBRC 105050]
MTAITDMTACALKDAIHARSVSAQEVMRAHLNQIAAENPSCNAIVSLADEGALLAEAAAQDELAARGEFAGPLHGFPHAIKDLSPARGFPTSMGSPLFAGTMAQKDGLAVSRVREAGAIIIGKTNAPEFGFGSNTVNPVFGATRNPYDLDRSAGGSSGGAAVALATRMTPLADGSDFGGSLRNPAGWNNVFGFRPTSGRVPKDPGEDVFFSQLGYEGPMARTIDDLALLLSVQAGYDPRHPLSLRDDPAAFAHPGERDCRDLKVGWLGDMGGSLPMEDGVLDVCRHALAAFETTGARVEEVDFPLSEPEIWNTWLALRHWGVGNAVRPLYDDPSKRKLLAPHVVWEIEGSIRQTGRDIHEAGVARTKLYRAFASLFERFDVLALPTAQLFPYSLEKMWPEAIAGVAMDTYHRWMEVTFAVSLSGCPALAVPAGFGGARNLPMGLQLVAPYHHDLDLLRIGRAYERVAEWTAIRPDRKGA